MKVLIPIAQGSEEMEAVILIDVLRRAKWEVSVVGLSDGSVTASRGVVLVPDTGWNQVNPTDYDMLILPGGLGGTDAFCKHEGLLQALRDFDAQGKWLGSICAAAKALYAAGILEQRRFTCYPGIEGQMGGKMICLDEMVVVDKNMITSQGPGTAFEFALRLIALGESEDLADAVRAGLLL